MSKFADVCAAYEQVETVTTYRIYAEPGPIATIVEAHRRLRKLLSDGDEDLAPISELFRNLSYRLVTTIVPPSTPTLELDQFMLELRAYLHQLDPLTPAHQAVKTADAALEDLMALERTPLAEEAIAVLETAAQGERTLVLQYGHHRDSTAQFLSDNGVASDVIIKSELRAARPTGTLVCVGWPKLYPYAVWNAPKSETVCFVQYPFGPTSEPSGGLFGTDAGMVTKAFRASGKPVADDTEALFDLDQSLVVAAQRIAVNAPTTDDAVPGALVLLEDGYAVWMSAGEGHWNWAIDYSDPEHPTVSTIKASEVKADTYLLFREKGAASELVRIIADREHGSAKHRAIQQRWKQAIRTAVAREGTYQAAAERLYDLGALTANLRHWVSEQSIKPQRRQDFDAVCRFAGLESEADELWKALTKIDRAHKRAGHTIRKQLEGILLDGVGDKLRSTGHERLDIEYYGTMSAFRVRHAHPEVKPVDPALIDEPFAAEERGWHG